MLSMYEYFQTNLTFQIVMYWSILLGFIAIWYDDILASESAYDIRGQIAISNDPGWQTRTLISANFGEYYGYAQQNGSFVIPNVKPGMFYAIHHTMYDSYIAIF